MEAPPKPTFNEAFELWLKLGFISFGGPAGQMPSCMNLLWRKEMDFR
jgi:chromate transport protein ChrA